MTSLPGGGLGGGYASIGAFGWWQVISVGPAPFGSRTLFIERHNVW